MIKRISIQNFKGIGERVDIDLRPVTLLFGANSAGKSTVLHALHYAHAILATGEAEVDITRLGGAIRLGGFQTLVHAHDLDKEVLISLLFEPTDEDLLLTGAGEEGEERFDVEEIEVELRIKWSPMLFLNRAIVTGFGVAINGQHLARIEQNITGTDGALVEIDLTHPVFEGQYDTDETYRMPCATGRKSAVPGWTQRLDIGLDQAVSLSGLFAMFTGQGRTLAIPEVAEVLDRWMRRAGQAAFRHLDRFLYVGPIRSQPARNMREQRTGDSDWASGRAAWNTLFAQAPIVAETNGWLNTMGVASAIHVHEIYPMSRATFEEKLGVLTGPLDVQVGVPGFLSGQPRHKELKMVNGQGVANDVCDLGEGITQVLPVIVAALTPAVDTSTGENLPPSLVAIEQPELHIHPRMQVVLGDLFLSQSQDRQFLIETHSEHLMLRLLRRIRETADDDLPAGAPKATVDDVVVYYVEQQDGEVRMNELRISEEGEFLDVWPEGFFGERLQELL